MRLTALLMSCLAFAAAALAHEHEEAPPEASPKTWLDSIGGELKLDDKQRERIKAILEESEAKTKAQRDELKSLVERIETLKKGLDASRRETDEKVRAELTLEQKERFDELRLRRREHQGGGERREFREEFFRRRFGPGGPGGGPGWGRDLPDTPPEMWYEHAPPVREPHAAPGPGGRPKEAPPKPDDEDDAR